MKKLFAVLVLVAFVIGVLCVLTLDRAFDAFGGDDSTLTYCQKVSYASSSVKQCLVEAHGSKWRPVTSLANYVSYVLYGDNVKWHILQNIFVHSLSAGLIGLCVRLLLLYQGVKRWLWLYPLLATCLYSFLGFSYYNFTQRFGLMEELCVFFFVGMSCLACVRGYDLIRMLSVYVLFALSMLAHERYIALAAYASLFALLSLEVRVRLRLALSLVPWLLAGGYLYIKGPVLGAGLLVGTAATEIELSLRPLLERCHSTLLNIMGYNNGPLHLAAYASPAFILYVAAVLLIVLVFLVGGSASKLHKDGLGRIILLFGSGFLPLVLSASVCFRTEFRWLVSPWVAFLLMLAALCIYLYKDPVKIKWYLVSAVAVVWVALSACQSLGIRRNIEQVFFMWWSRDAESMKNCLVRNYSDAEQPIEIFFASPCPMELSRDFVNPARYRIVSDAEWSGMSAARRSTVLVLSHYNYGWGFTRRTSP